jgi:F-type H+-transporting ATPase subunit delta
MSERTIARRYAKGLSVLTKTGSETEGHFQALCQSFEELAKTPEVFKFITNQHTSIPTAQKIATEISGAAKLSEDTKNFLNTIAQAGRFWLLPHILKEWRILMDQKEGLVRGTLITACPIDANQLQDVKETLSKGLKKSVELDCALDSSIIGGMVVKLPDTVLDFSVAKKLENMAEFALN